jgi:hypothetical protein
MKLDVVPFRDIWPIRSEVRVGNSAVIPVYGIGTVSLFIVLKDGRIKNIILNDCLNVSALRRSRFSWAKLKSVNEHFREDRGNILVRKIMNDKVIFWTRECPCTHLFNIPTKSLKVHLIYTF